MTPGQLSPRSQTSTPYPSLRASTPDEHGITTNYYLEPQTGREVYMESPDFIKVPTLLEEGMKMGIGTALLTSKEKLGVLLGRGATLSFSAENPS